MRRRGAAAALLAVLTLGSAVALGGQALGSIAWAVPGPGQATDGTRVLTVDNVDKLATSNARITVTGSGFDVEQGVYVAVCADGINRNKPLTSCIGGPVPDANPTAGWEHISNTAEGAISWGEGGTFSVTLTLAAAVGDSVDCLEQQCAVYARTDGSGPNNARDLTVPLTFNAPPPTTSAAPPTTQAPVTTQAPSTTSQAPTQVTVTAGAVAVPSVEIGQTQTVGFSGFLPGETVGLTLYSDPIRLPDQQAGPDGSLEVSFAIPDTVVPGQHTLVAIGQTSGGNASVGFEVAALPVPTTETPTSTSETSTAAATTMATTSSAPATLTTAATTAGITATSTTAETAVTAETVVQPTSDEVPGDRGSNSSKALWWLLAGLLIVLAVVAVFVIMAMKKRRERLEELQRAAAAEEAALLAAETEDAGAMTQLIEPVVGPELTPPGPRTFSSPRVGDQSLLAGREHADGPALYSGQQHPDEAPTSYLPAGAPQQPVADQPTEVSAPTAPVPPQPAAPQDGQDYGLFTHTVENPSTLARPVTPEPTAPDPTAGGPGTAQWIPDFDDDEDDDEVPPAHGWTPPPPRR